MNVPESLALADLLHFFPSSVEVTAVDQELGAEGPYRFIFFRVVSFGYGNQAPDAVDAGGQGNRLTVVPPCGSDHPSFPLLQGKAADQVQSTPNLEGPGWIVILVLDVGLTAEPFGEQGVQAQRGGFEVPIHRAPSFENSFDADLTIHFCIPSRFGGYMFL